MVYGLEWQDAATLVGKVTDYHILLGCLYRRLTVLPDHPRMVTVFNRRATVLCNDSKKWRKKVDFEALVYWTREASPEELAEFSIDEVDKTRGKRLLLRDMLSPM